MMCRNISNDRLSSEVHSHRSHSQHLIGQPPLHTVCQFAPNQGQISLRRNQLQLKKAAFIMSSNTDGNASSNTNTNTNRNLFSKIFNRKDKQSNSQSSSSSSAPADADTQTQPDTASTMSGATLVNPNGNHQQASSSPPTQQTSTTSTSADHNNLGALMSKAQSMPPAEFKAYLAQHKEATEAIYRKQGGGIAGGDWVSTQDSTTGVNP